MSTLTIRNVDEQVKRELRKFAAEQGISMEQEVRNALRAYVSERKMGRQQPRQNSNVSGKPWRLTATKEEILSLACKPDKPFDLKKVSDELYDYLERE